MKPLTGTIEYESQVKTYQSDLFVDLEHYMTFSHQQPMRKICLNL